MRAVEEDIANGKWVQGFLIDITVILFPMLLSNAQAFVGNLTIKPST